MGHRHEHQPQFITDTLHCDRPVRRNDPLVWYASWLILLVPYMASGLCNTAVAATTIPVAVTTCSTCNDQATLQAAAVTYFQSWVEQTPPGYVGVVSPVVTGSNPVECGTGAGATTLLVISSSIPLSATFFACWEEGAHGSHHVAAVPLSTATNAGAIATDNLLLTRSVKMDAVKLPSTLPLQGTDPIDLIGQWLAGDLIQTAITTSFWHGILTLNLPAVVQGTFKDISTGQTFTLWSGDTIMVTDSNGWTAKYQWIPSVTPPWQLVPGSVHNAKGQQVNLSNNTPITNGGSAQPGGPLTITVPGGTTIILTPWDDQTPGGTVIVCNLDGTCPGDGGGGGGDTTPVTMPN